MTEDARFEDAREEPLRLRALDPQDLDVLSALVQDSVFVASDMTWDRTRRRFAILLNRFRWEDRGRRHAPERVRSILAIEDAMAVRSQGIDRSETDTILSVLRLEWVEGDDGAGELVITLAGDGAVSVRVEALEVVLRDVTKPYVAPSGKSPEHRN